jgi:RNA polymerase sigma-70 factor (ECF subfamily)
MLKKDRVMNAVNLTTQSMESVLIERAVKGDLDAFNQLVLEYQSLVYNHAHALLGDPASAEDAAQESFIKAFQSLRQFRGGSFRAWMLRIVTNTVYDVLRQQKRHPIASLYPETNNGEEIESPQWIEDPSPSLQMMVEQREFTSTLYRMLDELPDVYRSALTLIDLHELDYMEAAQALGVPIGTVKSRLARARMYLKEKLKSRAEIGRNIADASLCLGV